MWYIFWPPLCPSRAHRPGRNILGLARLSRIKQLVFCAGLSGLYRVAGRTWGYEQLWRLVCGHNLDCNLLWSCVAEMGSGSEVDSSASPFAEPRLPTRERHRLTPPRRFLLSPPWLRLQLRHYTSALRRTYHRTTSLARFDSTAARPRLISDPWEPLF